MKHSTFIKSMLLVLIICEVHVILTCDSILNMVGAILLGIGTVLSIWAIYLTIKREKKQETEGEALLEKRKASLQICTIIGIGLIIGVMVLNLNTLYFLIATLGVVMFSVPVFYYLHHLK